jgi:hypothetical protein
MVILNFYWDNLFGFSCCKIWVTTKLYPNLDMKDSMLLSYSFLIHFWWHYVKMKWEPHSFLTLNQQENLKSGVNTMWVRDVYLSFGASLTYLFCYLLMTLCHLQYLVSQPLGIMQRYTFLLYISLFSIKCYINKLFCKNLPYSVKMAYNTM